MCGICGVVQFDRAKPVDEHALRRMQEAMVHRGPDDEGIYVDGPVGFAHRRLSIIDLGGGHQPMSNAEQTLWVTYNGEIFNFAEIRSLLESKGYVFRTRSDTEVILHAYSEFGERCMEHFRGMFAFALWDRPKRQLLLVRDRLGIKPVYHTVSNGSFLFASEIKALLRWPGVQREVDPIALHAYLRHRYVPGPRTLFRGIFKLQPGHLMTVGDGTVSERAYWDLPMGEAALDGSSEREFLERFEESVRLRLVSDVPLGVFLSGGVDSSTVVGVMTRMVQRPIQTFSVGYPDGGEGGEITEFQFARMAADRFHTDHHEFHLQPTDFWDVLPKLLWHFDEPVADPAAVPLYFLSRFAREFVTVALSGEGADELLAGYGIYRKMLSLERLRSIPLATRAAALLDQAAGRKLRRYLAWMTKPLRERYRGVSTLFSEEESNRLLAPDVLAAAGADPIAETYFDRSATKDPLSQMLYFDLKVWLPDDLLVKADKMTMATSLELRVPFLDHKLVEWAWQLPSHLKLRGGTGKYILRNAVAAELPGPILERPKLGFPVPLRSWFRGRLARMARELLLDSAGGRPEFFRRKELESLIDRNQRGSEDLSGELFALVLFMQWHHIFIDSDVESLGTSPHHSLTP